MAVQHRQHVAAVGCPMLFSRLISMIFFDILQNASWCNQTCSGCIAPTCSPLGAGLAALKGEGGFLSIE
jgi:hypothetical protein